jgi:hypothetical protein
MKGMRKRVWQVGLISVALIAAALFADYWFRCHGAPLRRAEALQRANTHLQYLSGDWDLGTPLPSLAEEQYDGKDGTWMFTFSNSVCTVDIITDRCHGTDVGGMSKGCTQPKMSPAKPGNR